MHLISPANTVVVTLILFDKNFLRTGATGFNSGLVDFIAISCG